MTPVRLIRWILLLGALFACITWACIAIDQMLNYSMSQQDRVAEYSATPQAPSVHLHEVDLAQRHWGKQSMFAIACCMGLLLAVMMNWVLDGWPRHDGHGQGDVELKQAEN